MHLLEGICKNPQIDLWLRDELGLSTVVMQAGASIGRTLVEKFEQMAAKCGYAIIILSADDESVEHGTGKKVKRARQNVIFEAGYFMGALKRMGNITFLVENVPGMDLPTDISGIGYISIAEGLGAAKEELRRELREAGLAK